MSTLTLAICARNAQGIIGECLESIRRQTVSPERVIVAVDDLSDPTGQVARAYGAEVLASGATGLYEARNAVLAACTTDYLAFTDADCVLAPEWVETAKRVLDERPDVGAGTGRHPPLRTTGFSWVAWLHHMWFVVETRSTGETDGVIGGNSYFRAAALRAVGGWLSLPGHSAAEDVYISKALRRAGYRIWFEEAAAAHHHYETRPRGLWRKGVMMGRDMMVMLRTARLYDRMFWYTLAIPTAALCMAAGVALIPLRPLAGVGIVAGLLLGSFLFFLRAFGNAATTFPRWLARWILIWPYAFGVLQGLVAALPRTGAGTASGKGDDDHG